MTLNLTVSIGEHRASGFVLKDTTGIKNEGGYRSHTSPISTDYFRTNDVVFLDIAVSKTLDGEGEVQGFLYNVSNDVGYLIYKWVFESKSDGWHEIAHIILPTLDWFKASTPSQLGRGIHYGYDNSTGKYIKLEVTDTGFVNHDGNIFEESSAGEIYRDLENSNIIGISQETFLIGRLESCFENLERNILYNHLYSACNYNNPSIAALKNDRDFMFIAYEIIKNLITQCEYYEAQRLLERLQGCNNICSNTHTISNMPLVGISNSGCNCNK